ncbi:MAG: putative quinol monooxygenase [Spirosomataceae bacterium]
MIRYVRMSFKPSEVSNFLSVFSQYKDQIRAVSGCQYVALQQDLDHPHIWMTHSVWDSPGHLEAYRKSALFQEVWGKTKPLFLEPAVAFSVENYLELT